jgi:hypothetical protein
MWYSLSGIASGRAVYLHSTRVRAPTNVACCNAVLAVKPNLDQAKALISDDYGADIWPDIREDEA